MEVRYIAVYRLIGLNQLLGEAETQDFVVLPNFNAKLSLTVNPELSCFHIDRASAIAIQFMKGLFGQQNEGTHQERLAEQIEEIRADRIKKHGRGVYLIFEGIDEIMSPDFKLRRDTEEFAVCFDVYPKESFRNKFRPALHGALTAISLALPDRADGRVAKIGDVSYLVEADSGKVIYSFTGHGEAVTVSIASPLSEDAMERARARARAFPVDGTLAKVANLLIESQETRTNELRAFIAAWSALEIFVSAMFKNPYGEQWFQIMSSSAPTSANTYFKRLKSVMSNKHRLADKFLVIASILDSAAAEEDASAFNRLKSVRDGLFHASEGAAARYPVEDAQKLLRKYMDLHLAQHDRPSKSSGRSPRR